MRSTLNMAHGEWDIEFYEKRNGRRPVEDFLDSLSHEEFARMDRQIGRLRRFGPGLQRPDAAYLGDKIWELRARWHRVRMRLLYWRDKHKFILSHGIRKKSSAVPRREIDKAIDYRNDYFARKEERGAR
jgi:phage-related protein